MIAIKQFLRTNGWMVVVILAGFLITIRFIDPAPPSTITMVTGSEEGRYYQVARQLKDELAKDGLEVKLLTSAGSIANLGMLVAEDNEISIGFVQSGVEHLFDGDTSTLRGLGSLYYEPIWLFYNRRRPVGFISDLEDRRVAVGAEGSGTKAVASLLLEASALLPVSGDARVKVQEIGGDDAAMALAVPRVATSWNPAS